MISPNNFDIAKKTAREFFNKTGLDIEVSIFNPENDTVPVKIKTDDPKMLIGQGGQTLAEIQKLLKMVLKRQVSEEFYIDIDVNDYKKKKAEYLKETAKETANEVFLTGREKVLPPMSSYERRIVHMELSSRSDVVAESMGQEPDRKIVIKPAIS